MVKSKREIMLENLLKEFINEWECDISGCANPDCTVCIRRNEYVNRVRKAIGMKPIIRKNLETR